MHQIFRFPNFMSLRFFHGTLAAWETGWVLFRQHFKHKPEGPKMAQTRGRCQVLMKTIAKTA
jgi:hypothetical protein